MNGNQAASVFLGSIILGVWLFLAFFETTLGTPWGLWGLLGLLMAAALYGIRLAYEGLRVVLWVVLGLSVGALVAAAFSQAELMILAALVTLTGGGLIAQSIPTPQELEQQRHGSWIVDEEPRDGPPQA